MLKSKPGFSGDGSPLDYSKQLTISSQKFYATKKHKNTKKLPGSFVLFALLCGCSRVVAVA